MNRDPSVQSNLDRIDRLKQNRTRRLKEEPSDATPGDTILIEDDVLVRENDKWTNITKPLRDRIAALETLIDERVTTLEDDIRELAVQPERTRETEERDTQVRFQQTYSEYIAEGDLQVQSERPFSPLERDIIEFVFGDIIDTDTFCIEVVKELQDPHQRRSGAYYADRRVMSLATGYYPYTDDINATSTVDNTEILRPQNLHYFDTIVHEAVHHWQNIHLEFTSGGPARNYDFNQSQLLDFENLTVEQHAQAVNIWFVIAWQLEHTPDGHNIDLTSRDIWDGVGTTNRYSRITQIPYTKREIVFTDGTSVTTQERIVSEAVAESILSDFEGLIDNLRTDSLVRRAIRFLRDRKPGGSPSQQN